MRNLFYKLIFGIFASIITLEMTLGRIALADTIYLTNGGELEGIIDKEDENNIELDTGFGTITCPNGQIKRVEKSSPEELDNIRSAWARKGQSLKASAEEFLRVREERFASYEKWSRETHAKRLKEERESKEIKLAKDPNSRNILVEALLNEKVKAALVVDTGASIVVLSSRIGRELGIDLTDKKKDVVELHLAGNRRVDAKMIVLKSIQIQNVEEREVMAAVLLEESTNLSFKDGLLGMTFLNRFNLKIDLKNMRMTLESLK